MNRGDRREPIFQEDAHRQRFIETLVTVAWIAERLQMGSMANVNTLLYPWRQGQHKK